MRRPVLVVHGTSSAPVLGRRFPTVTAAELDLPEARQAAAFLLHEPESGNAGEVLHRIRRHRLPEVYLKPVVLLTAGEGDQGGLARAVDAVWDAASSEELPPGVESRLERIRQQAETLDVTGPEGDSQLSFRILRFMATRDLEFTPEPSIRSHSGFRYPPLEPFLSNEDADSDVGELLAALESQRVLNGAFSTKAYGCTHCGCGFLNFVEICPDCGSADLAVDDMVHHFRCGHVAPLGDYEQEGELQCPKCDRELRHIGVDYDKPSMVYECKECQNRFPEPEITTTCYACRRTTPPELQVHRTVKAYRVSAFGQNAATHGLDSLFVSVLKQRVRLFDYEVLKQLVAAEGHRVDRYQKSESSLLVLSFQGIEHIYVELGRRAQELFQEMTVAIGAILRESDLLSVRNESLLLALLMETPSTAAERALERLREGIDPLLRSNLQHPPRMEARILPVAVGMDVDGIVADLMDADRADPSSREARVS